MPRTGGVYQAPAGTKGTPNTTIQSAPYNAFVDDLVADANGARPITAGGTGATNATQARTNLAVGGTGVTNTWSQLQTFSAGIGFGADDTLTFDDTANLLTLKVDGSATASGGFALGMLRLTNTTDASETSTAHAFQIGPDTGLNLRIDQNEILTVNNGAAGGALLIQNGVNFGTGVTLAITDGGTGAATAAAARTNLGLAAIAASGSASDLTTGTVPNARVAGSYTGIVGTGALNAGSITSGFGNINIGTAIFTGNGSGLTSLNASNLASGTVPNARISGAYDGITNLGMTGILTIQNAAPQIKMIDTTSGSYSARLLLDASNVRFDSSTDDVNFGEVFRFELDTKIGYVANSRIWTDAYATAAKINGVIGYTPVPPTRTITAGNGLSGGGDLSANRTFTLGAPLSITNSTGNVVGTNDHVHALGFLAAEVYTGSDPNLTTYPLGSIVAVVATGSTNRNASLAIAYRSTNSTEYVPTSHADAGGTLTGTWRARGLTSNSVQNFQRTA